MSRNQKFYLIGVTGFWGATVYFVIWYFILRFADVPETYNVVIGSFSFSMNRWFDVILFPIYVNLVLSVYLWLTPVLEKRGSNREHLAEGLIAGLVLGSLAGLMGLIGVVLGFGFTAVGYVIVLAAGLVVGFIGLLVVGSYTDFAAGFVTIFTSGLAAGFVSGIVFGFTTALLAGIILWLMAGLAAGFILLVKTIVEIHKLAFNKIC